MVDPNRKINRFTDRDIEFLEECEREFGTRYSEEDAEFMEHCSKPLADPPILENFSQSGSGGHGGNSGGHPYQHHRRGGHSHQQNRGGNRGWRGYGGGGGGGGGNRNFRPRRGGRGGGRYYGDQNGYEHHDQGPRREPYPSNRPPMNVRRDYGNFVAASKED